jgi:hypothetical protein
MLIIRSAKNRLFGFIDYHGEIVIQPRFHDVAPFAGLGLAAARITNDREGAFGYIDRAGNVVIGPSFFSAHNFTSQGIALVVFDRRRDFLHGFIDAQGRQVVASLFEYASSFDEFGRALIRTPEGGHGCIDIDGKLVIPRFSTRSEGSPQTVLQRPGASISQASSTLQGTKFCVRDSRFSVSSMHAGCRPSSAAITATATWTRPAR